MTEAFDYTTLNWVRRELDETLKQARLLLEAFTEYTGDPDRLRDCVAHLHQAHGTLKMIELDGADRLAEEMEGLVNALIEGRVEHCSGALEALMQAFRQLEEYMSRLGDGRRCMPMVLLPLINTLRAASGAKPVPESALFYPDFVRPMPAKLFSANNPPDQLALRQLARKHRQSFQAGLLEWYRADGDSTGLQKILTVLDQLQRASGLEPVARIWWLSAAVTEALIGGALQATLETKQLLGQVDRQIKYLIEKGEAALVSALPADLLKGLLYQAARAQDCDGRMDAIKTVYSLADLLPGESELRAALEENGGSDEALLYSVSVSARQTLEKIEERLDVFMRSGHENPSDLAAIAEDMHGLGNTIAMIDMDELSRELEEKEKSIRVMARDIRKVKESELLAVASTLIAVEFALADICGNAGTVVRGVAGERHAFRQGLEAVVQEVTEDILRTKQVINRYIKTPIDIEMLADIPELLAGIDGGLRLAGQERVALLAGRLGKYINNGLLENRNRPDDAQLDTLADAICSIEYHLEELSEQRIHGSMTLDLAEISIARLEDSVRLFEEGVLPTDIDSADEANHEQPDDAVEPLPAVDLATIKQAATRDPTSDETSAAEISAEAGHCDASAPAQEIPQVLQVPDISGLQVIDAHADVEILEIFIEEAGEELDKLGEEIPRWIANPGDDNTLTSIRRTFHTLKGSGRMVGALAVGEFTWTLEELLNRVIDRSVIPSGTLFELFKLAPTALDQLIRQIRGEGPPTVDVTGLMTCAAALSRGETIHVDGLLTTDPGANRHLPHHAADAQVSESVRPQAAENAELSLLDVFRNECRQHLQVMRFFVSDCHRDQESCRVTEPLYRALHTLSGISESADAEHVSRLATGLYRYFDALYIAQSDVPKAALAVLGESTDAIAELVETMPGKAPDPYSLASLHVRIAGLAEPMYEAPVGEAVSGKLPVEEPPVQLHRVAGAVEAMVDTPAPDAEEACGVEMTAAPAAEQAGEDPYAEMDPELFEIFIEEAGELVDASEMTLRSWLDAPDNLELLSELHRQLHTLKGSARMVDINAIGDLSHSMEALLTRVSDGHVTASRHLFELLYEAHDRLVVMLEKVKARQVPGAADRLNADLNGLEDDGNVRVAADPAESVVGRAIDEAPVPGPDRVGTVVLPGDEASALTTATGEPADRVSSLQAGGSSESAASAPPDAESAIPPGDGAGATADFAGEPAVPCDEVLPADANVVPEAAAGDPAKNTTAESMSSALAGVTVATEVPDAVEQAISRAIKFEADRKSAPASQHVDRRKQSRVKSEQVRVQAELLDNLVNYAGEINIYRSRLEQQTNAYRFNLTELEQTISRLRSQLRQLEIETETQILFRHEQEGGEQNVGFDPLEMDRYSNLQQLSRSLMESISDLRSIQELLENTTRESETLLLQQSRVSTDMQESLMRARMIPFSGLAPRLRRIVRQTAQELGRKVELALGGSEGEMDRAVIERIIAPLEHMLRNAVAHGIESPEQRQEAGKPPTGNITIDFNREGPEIVLRIADDGAGINIGAIREKAMERGMIADGEDLQDSEIARFILHTGFSTADEVTQISGRGVGMDVVNSEIRQLGGTLHIDSTPGAGTVFTMRMPYTLAINQALLVRAGEDTFCIPLDSIEGIVRIAPQHLAACYASQDAAYEYAGNLYHLCHLGSLLESGGTEPGAAYDSVPVLLVRAGEKRTALQVEALLGSREIVVKPLGAQLSTVDGVSGATILGDGRVVMILDLAALLRMNTALRAPDVQQQVVAENRLVVMVVDDSITVRKVTSRLLKRHGFKVVTASDGVDAMCKLQETVPDIMLLDIEMPHMDGFELASHMRNDEHLRHVPIVMITSRTGDKHRERANLIGVERYLGKPYQESELMDAISRLIGLNNEAVRV